MESIGKVLDFIKICEKLKDTPRSASHTSSGKRESVAEHSWRMALLAACLLPYFPELDAKKVLTVCLIHDLPEQITGDVSAAELPDAHNKLSSERSAAADLFSLLPEDLNRLLTSEYDDYSFLSSWNELEGVRVNTGNEIQDYATEQRMTDMIDLYRE